MASPVDRTTMDDAMVATDPDSGFRAADVVTVVDGITADTPCGDAVSRMLEQPELPCLVVVGDAGTPLGMVERERLLSVFAHQLKAELYRRRPIHTFIENDVLSVDEGTHLDDISAMIASRWPRALVTGFVITSDGRYVGIGTGIGLLSKLVEQNRLRANELDIARAAAESANRAKSTFLASMSHEIRTPLNGVIGNLELLRHADSDAERHDLVGSATASAQTLLQIIGDVLDFSKIESDRIELEAVPLDPEEMVRESVALFAPRARQRGLSLIAHVGAGLPRRIVGDPLRLRQIVMNFIGNALKFTEEGGVTVTLRRVWAPLEPPRLRVEVSDTGPGFDSSKADTLFEAFTQADESTSRRYGGTGLGLAISRKLVAMMGGTIGAQASPGTGATFWFELPVSAATDADPTPLPAPDRLTLKGARILLFDGGEGGNDAVRPLLEADGAEVQVATSLMTGITALRASTRPFDAILLDARLPDGDGLVIAELVADAPSRLLLTAPGEDMALVRLAYRRGFARVVAQPCPSVEVRRAVIAVIGRPAPGSQPVGGRVTFGSPDDTTDFSNRCGDRPILVIDDTPMNLTVARRQLKKLGLACETAADGAEGLRLATSRPYALILVDRSMPVMDGHDFARRLRAWEAERGRRVPVVAMTAHALAEDIRASLEVGMDDHLTKPVSLDRLASVLDRWLPPPPNLPIEEPGDEPPVDLSKLSAILGGASEEELREVLTFFAESFPPLLDRLTGALDAHDTTALRDAAHAAKSAARNVGALGLGDALAMIEDRAPTSDWAQLRALTDEAVGGFTAARAFAERY